LHLNNVRSGITGWTQVNGRNTISWEESFWLDLKVLFLTVKKVFRRESLSVNDEANMPRFTGRNLK